MTFKHKNRIWGLLMLVIMGMIACNPQQEQFEGYKLIEKRFVKEVNADVYYLEHIKSGAHIVKVAADDPNKTFAVGFKTEPNSNSGTPHIIEHSVLNGSKNYPVKSPFDEMGKTSLNTFLNAFTSSDFTFYPVASMNEKDYFNLMGVYLDAVFFPLIYDDPRIFKQEGWHYELTDKQSPVVYKGVVYNEMKGAFSSPQRELAYQINKNLFPDNGYGLSSGGYPMDIPDLTYEDFLAFHKKNYHPANSLVMIYGDADIKKELELIDKQYLSKFDKIEINNETKPQAPFTEMKEVTAPYSVIEGTPTENQTFLSLSWVYGNGYNREQAIPLDILADVLVNQESAPIRLALQEAGIGRDISAYNSSNQQNTFTITVKNANPEDKDKFKEIVLNVLKEQVEKKLDKNAIEAYVNRLEFNLREGNSSQKGLNALFPCFSNWMFTKDPFYGIEWEKPLAELKTKFNDGILENMINEAMLNNNHALLLVLKPKPGLEKELAEQTTQKLAEYKASLSDEELEKLIKETQELIEYQKREDDPEALAKLPKLGREDIKPEGEWFEAEEKDVEGTKVLHFNDFTNGVVYTNLMFDLKALPEELIPYASLLTNLVGKMDTENHKFGDLEKEIRKNTGTFYTYINTWIENYDDTKLIPKFVVVSKAMPEKTDKMFELMNEVLFTTKFDDTERLKNLLVRHQARLQSRVKNSGLNYAMTRTMSYFSNSGVFSELTNGFEYYWFINDIVKDFDNNSAQVVANIKKTAELLFNKSNIITGTACYNEDYNVFTKAYTAFVNQLPEKEVEKQEWKFNPAKKNEAFVSASKVQYVVKAFNFRKLGYDWDGKMAVLNNILSNDYLQTQVRVIGGAYGGFSGISNDGTVYFGSYRDPNLKETLINYDSSATYLANFKADEQTMLGYIIGAVSNLDYPLTASQKANVAYGRYFSKYTKEQMEANRKALLSTTVEDINKMAKMIEDVLKENTYCVYGNKEKIEANKDLFNSIENLEKSL